MKNRYAALTLAVGLAGVLLLGQILFGQAPAQGGAAPAGAPGQGPGAAGGRGGRGGGPPAPPPGPVVRGKDGHPDLTGYWMTQLRDTRPNFERGVTGNHIPYNDEWEAKSADVKKNHMFDEPYAHCLPAGIPTNLGLQMGFQIVQDKNSLAWAWDTVGATRLIYLGNRKHLPDSIKLYQGDSIGHWEGDTLVVDTANIEAGWWDASGEVHSDKTHVVEKFTMKDSNNITWEAVVEDPVALTGPMTITDNIRRNLNVPLGFKNRPTGYEQTETACIEGEQDTILYTESGGGLAKDGTPGAGAPPGSLTTGGRGGGGRGGPGGPPRGGPPGTPPGPPRGQ